MKITKKSLAILILSCLHTQNSPTQKSPRVNFFKDTMGINENTFKKNTDTIRSSIKKDGQNYFVGNKDTNKWYQAGQLKILKLENLRLKTEKKLKTKTPNNGTFNVIVGVNPLGSNNVKKHVDIGAMQADPKNQNAVFQVASNFNALELISSNDSMENITNYIYDYTQGPFASISAAPGLIFRHYYYFMDDKKAPYKWRQTPTHQLNLLENTGIPVNNSYISLDKKTIDNFDKIKLQSNFKVAYHKNTQTTFGFVPINSKKQEVTQNKKQIINQIFTAAIDLNGENYTHSENSKAINIAQAILDCGYESTLKASYIDDKKTVFLTMVGCGVFGNNPNWLFDAINKQINFIKKSGLNVTLVIFDKNNISPDDLSQFKSLIKQTNGKYSEYRKEESIIIDYGLHNKILHFTKDITVLSNSI